MSPEVAESAVKATCILHNYMRWDGEGEDGPRTPTVPSQGAVQSIPRVGSNKASSRSEVDLQPLFFISAWSSDLAGWNLVYHFVYIYFVYIMIYFLSFCIYLNQKRRKTKTNNKIS